MRVNCIGIPKGAYALDLSSSAWLTIGRKYVVLGVIARPGRRVQLHLLTDDRESFGWFDSEYFETDDGTVPASWCVKVSDGVVEFGPQDWLLEGFWERYYDGEFAAVESVKRELAIIVR